MMRARSMKYLSGLVLVAALLPPVVIAEEERLDPVRAAVMREAERYVNCLMSVDVRCVEEMTDQERLAAVTNPELDEMFLEQFMTQSQEHFHRLALAPPWVPYASGDEVFVVVPAFETAADVETGMRIEAMVYLVGTSGDGGESWRFIIFDRYSEGRALAFDRVLPSRDEWPRPDIVVVCFSERPYARSRWLETTQRGFVAIDDAFAYTGSFAIRREIEGTMDITVRYENPADPGLPPQFLGSLQPEQSKLEWQSPTIGKLEVGETYDVVVEGSDPTTGRRIFQHREELLFHPTYDYWFSAWSKPPAEWPQPLAALLSTLSEEEECRSLGLGTTYSATGKL